MAKLLIALHSAVLEESSSGIGGLRSGVKGSGYMREGEETWIWMTFAEVDDGGMIGLLPKSCHGVELGAKKERWVRVKLGEETEHIAL